MKKIINPYVALPGYNCFGCSPNNIAGLKMEFYEDGDYICSDWKPSDIYQGYTGVLHGGIQASMMDEIASWVVLTKLKTAGVTSKMDVRYLKPVIIDSGKVVLKAKFKSWKKNFALVDVSLYNAEMILCSTAEVVYYTVDKAKAKEKYNYPGVEHFFEK